MEFILYEPLCHMLFLGQGKLFHLLIYAPRCQTFFQGGVGLGKDFFDEFLPLLVLITRLPTTKTTNDTKM